MSGYEKQDWSSPYAAPQGQGGYQQPPPQQVWNQQQQGGYQGPPGYSAPQQGYGSPQPPQGQYGAPPQQQQQQQQRHSVCFKFTGTKETILNSQVVDPYGKVPFSVVSDKKHTTVSTADGSTLAVMDWNHSSPVMHYGGKKLQCREWIKLHKKEKIRVLHHAGKEYHWTTRDQTVYLEAADRPGYHILIWRDPTGVVEIEAFQEALTVPGLLEAAIVSVVIMQSNHKLGEGGGGSNTMVNSAIATAIITNFSF